MDTIALQPHPLPPLLWHSRVFDASMPWVLRLVAFELPQFCHDCFFFHFRLQKPSSTASGEASSVRESALSVRGDVHFSHLLPFSSPPASHRTRYPVPGPPQSSTFSVPDCRSMVKTLVCGVKTITWGAGSCKVPGGNHVTPAEPAISSI